MSCIYRKILKIGPYDILMTPNIVAVRKLAYKESKRPLKLEDNNTPPTYNPGLTRVNNQ
jgi:hypothetical protein